MACQGAITGLMLTAGSLMLSNAWGKIPGTEGTGIGQSSDLGKALGDFVGDIPIIGDITEAIGTVADNVAEWGSSVLDDFAQMGAEAFPGLGNAVSDEVWNNVKSVVASESMTAMIGTLSEEVVGIDVGVFTQSLAQGRGFQASTNRFLSSAVVDAAIDAAEEYYNPITRQVTGQMSLVNKALPTFSTELADTGGILDFENLNTLGNPLALANNIYKTTGSLAVLESALVAQGINPDALIKVLQESPDLNSIAGLSVGETLGTSGLVTFDEQTIITDPLSGGVTNYTTQGSLPPTTGLGKAVYNAFGSVTGDDLSRVQSVLGSTVPNVSSGQDLLNPVKLFPTSYPSIASIPAGGSAKQATENAQSLLDNSAKVYVS